LYSLGSTSDRRLAFGFTSPSGLRLARQSILLSDPK